MRALTSAFLVALPAGVILSACFGMRQIAGKQVCGFVWTCQLALALAIILIFPWRSPWRYYWLWLPWCFWAALRCDWSDFIAIQRTIMLTSCPIICLAAERSVTKKTDLKWLLRSFVPLILIVGPFVMLDSKGIFPFEQFAPVGGAVTAMCLGACYFSVLSSVAPAIGVPMWLLSTICCGLLGSRMATAVSLLVFILPLSGERIWLRVFRICLVVALGIGAASLPSIQSKSFRESIPIGNLWSSMESVQTSGRSYMWPLYWEEAIKTPILGAGATADLHVGMDIPSLIEIPWEHPHCDYLRVFLNYGLLGLFLLGVPLIYTSVCLYSIARKAKDMTLRIAAAAGLSGFIAMALLSVTGNVLIYIPFYGFMLFALVGACFALRGTALGQSPRVDERLSGRRQLT